MYYKIHSFRKYNSMAFSKLTELCNYHHSLLQTIFITSKKNLLPISAAYFPVPSPRPPSICFLFYGYAYSGYFLETESYSMRAFVAGFFYLVSTMFTRLIHNTACLMQMYSFLGQNNILLRGYMPFCFSLPRLADTWAAPTFGQL